ncbi:RNA-directed DNA polymerase from mobile element jockey [Trichonephila clavipes]|nr:RNA-directed DNA polymerase from mobile element jockey [Trichonephila clavipes]
MGTWQDIGDRANLTTLATKLSSEYVICEGGVTQPFSLVFPTESLSSPWSLEWGWFPFGTSNYTRSFRLAGVRSGQIRKVRGRVPIGRAKSLANRVQVVLRKWRTNQNDPAPQAWKTASVIPILKPGKDPTLPESFRPILLVVEYIKTGFKDRKSTGVVSLDIQKAFDRVWHTGLLYKLIKINTPPHLIKVISSYLSNRNFSVRVNNIQSTNRPVQCGVPQGSLLALALFNIYTNDIPRTSQTTICMYADDTSICAQSNELALITHFLHEDLAKLEKWFSIWKIALNVSKKTGAVFFSRHIKKQPLDLYLHNTHAPWSGNTKYLGVILDKRLTFKQHIIHIRRNFNIAVAKVYPLISRNSCLSMTNKMRDWFMRNDDLRSDLKLKTLKEVFKKK